MQPSPARSPRSAFVPLPAPSPLLPSPLFSSPYGSERGAAGGPQPILARRRRSNAARSLPAPTAVSAAATGPPRPRALPPLGRGRGEGSGGGGGVPGGSSAARARPARGIVGRRAAGGGGSGGRRGGVKGQRPPASMAGRAALSAPGSSAAPRGTEARDGTGPLRGSAAFVPRRSAQRRLYLPRAHRLRAAVRREVAVGSGGPAGRSRALPAPCGVRRSHPGAGLRAARGTAAGLCAASARVGAAPRSAPRKG